MVGKGTIMAWSQSGLHHQFLLPRSEIHMSEVLLDTQGILGTVLGGSSTNERRVQDFKAVKP